MRAEFEITHGTPNGRAQRLLEEFVQASRLTRVIGHTPAVYHVAAMPQIFIDIARRHGG